MFNQFCDAILREWLVFNSTTPLFCASIGVNKAQNSKIKFGHLSAKYILYDNGGYLVKTEINIVDFCVNERKI